MVELRGVDVDKIGNWEDDVSIGSLDETATDVEICVEGC